MKIVLAFDSYKGCMSAEEACEAAEIGIRSVFGDAQIEKLPLSDGGEGLVACISNIIETKKTSVLVHGPLMGPTYSQYLISTDGTTAYMEMASASGITLIDEKQRNSVLTTTFGVGEMIADAISKGCTKIVMGIGGSATCDGGKGMMEALSMLNTNYRECTFVAACDVANPLFGINGAAYVYGPQKGANAEQVKLLDRRLRLFAKETENKGIATSSMAYAAGAGAAGGLGYAMMAYLKAELKPGIEIMLDIARFDEKIKDADVVITGEGKSDKQTLMGKVAYGVLKHCKSKGIPTWLVSGTIEDADNALSSKFTMTKSINAKDKRPLNELVKKDVATKNLSQTIKRLLTQAYVVNKDI